MSRIKFPAALILLITIVKVPGVAQNWLESADERIEEIRKGNFAFSIKDELGNAYTDSVNIELINHEYVWGSIVPVKDAPNYRWSRATVTRFYNYGVVGNEFKWPWIEPVRDNPVYTVTDEVLEWAQKVGIGFRGHALLWGGDESWQMPSWTLNGSLSQEEIYTACETHIRRDVNYWKGRINEYDVVNEPSEGHETWLAENVGDSINWNSFKWAHEADSDAVLYVNDYNIIVWGNAPAYKTLIETMLSNGAPVNGIGVQGHMDGTIGWSDVKAKLDMMAEIGLPIRITEFDMKIDEYGVSEEDQAAAYATMMRIAFSHPAVNGIIMWALWDGEAWRAGSGIFSEDRMPKIAADTVYNLIHQKWTTKLKDAASGSEHQYSFRGFYGDYRITVGFDGEMREFILPARSENSDSVFVLEYTNSVPANANLVQSQIGKDADCIQLVFDRAMDFTSFAPGDFSVNSLDDYTITGFEEIDSVSVKMFLNAVQYKPRQYFAVFYDGDTARAKNMALLNRFGPDKIINELPAFLGAQTDTAGSKISVRFSKAMDEAVNINDFSIEVNGTEVSISIGYIDAVDNTTILMELAGPVNYSDQIRLEYTEAGYRSADGYKLLSFGPKYVENRVPDTSSETGLMEESLINQPTAYPNPFTDELIFTNLDNTYRIILYDGQGRIINTIRTEGQNSIVLNSSGISPGLVVARFVSSNMETIRSICLTKEQ